jgi:hypothetical protein
MTHARVGLPFFDTALQQAALICNLVPVRGAFRPGTDIPAVPFMLHYNAKARISRIRVWGCPVVAKAYLRRDATGRILQDHNLVQRGVRGIYVGFPIDQARYLIWIPSARQFAVSADVSFDEEFSSTLAYDGRLYHDSLPIRTTTNAPLDILSPLAWTGPPLVVPNPADADDPWTPSTIFPPTHPTNDPMDWTPWHVDLFPSIEEGRVVVDALRTNSSGDRGDVSIPSVTTTHTYDSNDDDFVANDDVDARFASVIAASLKAQSAAFCQRQVVPPAGATTLDEADDDMPSLLPPGVCNSAAEDFNDPPVEASIASRAGRRGQGTSLLSYANQVASRVLPSTMKEHAELAFDLAESIHPITSGDPGSDPTPFLPEPAGLYKVLKQHIATRRPWIQSLVKELKGLVKDRGAFKKELLGLNDTVIPVKEVF